MEPGSEDQSFTKSRAIVVDSIPADTNAHFQLHAEAAACHKYVSFPPSEVLAFLIREPASPFTERLVFILNISDAILATDLRQTFLSSGGAAALVSALSAHAGTPKTTHQLTLFAATLARCSDAHDAMHAAGSVPALLALLARYSRTEHYAVSVTMVGALQLLTEGKGRKRDPALASLGTLRLWTRMLLTWRPPTGVDHAEVLVAMAKLLTRGVSSPAEKHMSADAYVAQLLDTAQVLIGLTFAHGSPTSGIEFAQDLMHAIMAVTTRCPAGRVAEVLNKGLAQLAVFLLSSRADPMHGYCNTPSPPRTHPAGAALLADASADRAGAVGDGSGVKAALAAAVADVTARQTGEQGAAAAKGAEGSVAPPAPPATPHESTIAPPTLAMTTVSLLHRVVVGAASARDASEAVVGAGCVPLLIAGLARDSVWEHAIAAAGPASAALAIVVAQLKVLAADTFSYVASHCTPDSRLLMILSGVPALLGRCLSDALFEPGDACGRRYCRLPAPPLPSLVKALAAVIGVPHKTLHALAPMEKFDAAAVLVARYDAAEAAAAQAASAADTLAPAPAAPPAAAATAAAPNVVGAAAAALSLAAAATPCAPDAPVEPAAASKQLPPPSTAAVATFAPEKSWTESAIPDDACSPATSRVTEVCIGAAVPFLLGVLAARSAYALAPPPLPTAPAPESSPDRAATAGATDVLQRLAALVKTGEENPSPWPAVAAAAVTRSASAAPPPQPPDTSPAPPSAAAASDGGASPWDRVAELAMLSLEVLARRHNCHRKAIRRGGGEALCVAIAGDPAARPQLQSAARRTHSLVTACCTTGYHAATANASAGGALLPAHHGHSHSHAHQHPPPGASATPPAATAAASLAGAAPAAPLSLPGPG